MALRTCLGECGARKAILARVDNYMARYRDGSLPSVRGIYFGKGCAFYVSKGAIDQERADACVSWFRGLEDNELVESFERFVAVANRSWS